jgi:uncharacterized membrane protein YdjX (TVP38/TMEM64 family)
VDAAEPAGTAPPPPRCTAWGRWALAAALLAAVVLFYALGLHRSLSWEAVRQEIDALRDAVNQHLLLSALLFFLVYAAVTGLSLPVAAPLSLAAGALLGRWLGTAVVSAAATLGATAAFLSSRYVLRDVVRRRFGPRLAALDRGLEEDGAFYLFTLRLIPLFPFFLVNLGMGLTRLRLRTFVWVSWLGMLPGTFLYVNAGTEIARIQSPADVLSPTLIASLAALGVVPLALRLLLKRRKPRPPEANAP